MQPDVAEFVVQGVTVEGEALQPTNWLERLYESLSKIETVSRKTYSSYTRPVLREGIKSLVVRVSLQEADPDAFELIKQFVAENHLMVRSGRGSRDAETTGPYTAIDKERRDPKRNNW